MTRPVIHVLLGCMKNEVVGRDKLGQDTMWTSV